MELPARCNKTTRAVEERRVGGREQENGRENDRYASVFRSIVLLDRFDSSCSPDNRAIHE